MLERKLHCRQNYCQPNTSPHTSSLRRLVIAPDTKVSCHSRQFQKALEKHNFTLKKKEKRIAKQYTCFYIAYSQTTKYPITHIKNTDFTSYGHDELVEFAQPHDITGFGPEPPIPQYLPVDYDNHFPVPHAQNYGPPPPSHLLLESPHSHSLPNFISTDRKGKSYSH